MSDELDPAHILQTGSAFWASKVLLTATAMDLFTVLRDDRMTARELGHALGLHPRAWYDYFDALVALGFLQRDGDGQQALYRNTPETRAFLVSGEPGYVGGMLKMMNESHYPDWKHLEKALKTGQPQSDQSGDVHGGFDEIYGDPEQMERFLEGMTGIQMANFHILAEAFDWSRYQTVADVGGALAALSRTVAKAQPHLTFTSFDLPQVAPLAQARVDADGLSDRITVAGGDFFADPLPKADVITMGNILHDWNLEKKKVLIAKAYEALPSGGAFIAIENVIDDARRTNAFGLLMSLNMLVHLGDGFDYTAAQFREWCQEAGFRHFDAIPLAGPATALVAYR